MIAQYRIEVHGKVQIWTEFHLYKKDEIHLYNHKDFASDCCLILDLKTKSVLKSTPYLSESKFLGTVESEKQKLIEQAKDIDDNGCEDIFCSDCVLNKACLCRECQEKSPSVARGFLLGIDFEKGD